MFGPFGMWEIVLILTVVLIIFGPGKLPDVGKAIGKGLREFKSAANSITSMEEEKVQEPVDVTPKEKQEA